MDDILPTGYPVLVNELSYQKHQSKEAYFKQKQCAKKVFMQIGHRRTDKTSWKTYKPQDIDRISLLGEGGWKGCYEIHRQGHKEGYDRV